MTETLIEEPVWRQTNKKFIDRARACLRQTHCTFVLGAGVSMSAHVPGWQELLESLLCKTSNLRKEDFKALVDSFNHSEIRIASYIINAYYRSQRSKDPIEKKITELGKSIRNILSSESESDDSNAKLKHLLYDAVNYSTPKWDETIDIKNIIKEILYSTIGDKEESDGGKKELDLISVICKIISNTENKIESVISYNFDDLIEKELSKSGVECIPVFKGNRPEDTYKFPIYHVHGFIPRDGKYSEIVFSETDYHKLYTDFLYWSNIEQLHAFYRNTCFFVGLSMEDPNLRRLLENAFKGSDGQARHYAILERKLFYEDDEKNEMDIAEREAILHDLGLNIIWYENKDHDHHEVVDVLKKLADQVSAAEYDEI